MSKPILVFDMDGVLVDVTESYRETIAQTAGRFTGQPVSRERIQEYKNQGGWNDDWKLTHRLVTDAGVDAPFESVKQAFQELFLGENGDGLIQHERWVARPGILEWLEERFHLGVFTGRPREEAELTLARFANGIRFAPVICMGDCESKPSPDGLLRIAASNPGHEIYYVGDTVDDARCARAAGVKFVGVASPLNPLYLDLVFLFQEEGAYAMVDDINFLIEVFQ
jgi:HAD superfamily phosphatase